MPQSQETMLTCRNTPTGFSVNSPLVKKHWCFFFIFFILICFQSKLDFHDYLQARTKSETTAGKAELIRLEKSLWRATALPPLCGQHKILEHMHNRTKTHEMKHGGGITRATRQKPQFCGTKQDQKPWIRRNCVHLTPKHPKQWEGDRFGLSALSAFYSVSPDK